MAGEGKVSKVLRSMLKSEEKGPAGMQGPKSVNLVTREVESQSPAKSWQDPISTNCWVLWHVPVTLATRGKHK
jgi:hypothetical protein